MRRFGWTTLLLSLLAATLVAATPAASPNWPSRIDLPTGFLTEGIAIGKGHTFYVGSTATTGPFAGMIYAGDLRTGEGALLPLSGGTGKSALRDLRRREMQPAVGGRRLDRTRVRLRRDHRRAAEGLHGRADAAAVHQ